MRKKHAIKWQYVKKKKSIKLWLPVRMRQRQTKATMARENVSHKTILGGNCTTNAVDECCAYTHTRPALNSHTYMYMYMCVAFWFCGYIICLSTHCISKAISHQLTAKLAANNIKVTSKIPKPHADICDSNISPQQYTSKRKINTNRY